jgi:hypothetical protein
VSFLEHAHNHPPLKYTCPIKVSDQIRPVLFNSDLTHNRIKSSGCICAWALGTHGCVNLQRASRVYGQFWTCWRSHACVWGAWALGQSYWLLLVIYHGHNPFNNYVLCNSNWADILFWRAVSAMLWKILQFRIVILVIVHGFFSLHRVTLTLQVAEYFFSFACQPVLKGKVIFAQCRQHTFWVCIVGLLWQFVRQEGSCNRSYQPETKIISQQPPSMVRMRIQIQIPFPWNTFTPKAMYSSLLIFLVKDFEPLDRWLGLIGVNCSESCARVDSLLSSNWCEYFAGVR